ncbi:hypothetical protein NP493_796g01026 [Ridgeia piscesae]|uniref:Uncharacterized protein n=1 Tax=Ridgeia piscesae TaxID=27915 RepID=A0AAD9KPL0_RIDPI|nr:hypothetical protein NP493_796g01026 [Ridgeia piscesae]
MSSDGLSSESATALLGGRKSDSTRVISNDVTLSSQQLEERFRDLTLRFKANKVKLEERAKQHKHNRDITEENINRELTDLHKLLKSVTSSDTEIHVLCTRLRQHVSVLEQTSRQLASRCEEHGAVKQELRESSEVDMMIQYVENLKREYENLKHTSSMATPQSAGARQRARGQNALPRRATVQTISPSSYQEKLSVTGKALRRAVSCFPSMSTKHLATEVAKEQDALVRLKGGDNDDTSSTGAADDGGDAVQRLESVEEVESLEAPASNGSVSNGRTPPDGTHNRLRTLVRRKTVRQFSDHNDTLTVTEEPESLFDDCVTSTQDTERSSCAQRVTSWLAPWRWGGTMVQKLRYVFSCLIFVCGIITFVFIFVPTRKALKMDSNAQTVEVDDILKPYTSLRHHAAPPV